MNRVVLSFSSPATESNLPQNLVHGAQLMVTWMTQSGLSPSVSFRQVSRQEAQGDPDMLSRLADGIDSIHLCELGVPEDQLPAARTVVQPLLDELARCLGA